MKPNTRLTQTFIGLMVFAAIASTVYASLASHTLHVSYALAVLALAAATSRMKVKLPGIDGNMSVNLPFLLMAVVNLSALEAVLIACVSTVVQCWPKSRRQVQARPDAVQPQHDGLRHQHGQPDLECRLAGQGSVGLGTADVGFGNRCFFPGADGSSGGHYQTRRGSGHAPHLAQHRATVIPLLCAERGDDLNGKSGKSSSGLAGSLGGLPGDVWNPSLLPGVLWPRSRGWAHAAGTSGHRRSIRKDGRASSPAKPRISGSEEY